MSLLTLATILELYTPERDSVSVCMYVGPWVEVLDGCKASCGRYTICYRHDHPIATGEESRDRFLRLQLLRRRTTLLKPREPRPLARPLVLTSVRQVDSIMSMCIDNIINKVTMHSHRFTILP